MPFATGDRTRIVEALGLTREIDTSTSILARLMDKLETFDTTNSTTYANKVVAALDRLDAIDAEMADIIANSNIKREEVDREFKIEYFSRNGATAALRHDRSYQLHSIRMMLDPREYLYSYTSSSRVIGGI